MKTEDSIRCSATQLNRAFLAHTLVCFAVVVFSLSSLHSAIGASTFSDANWTSVGSGLNGWVYALAVSGSDVYAAGEFSRATNSGGVAVAAYSIAKWDGSTWTALGSGIYGSVYALAVSGSDLYAGGRFTTAGGSAATNIAKWNGSSWSALGSGMGRANGTSPHEVYALAVSGSDLYAGGRFTTAGGSAANYIAKWDGSSWSALGSELGDAGLTGGVYALAVSGNDVYAGGYFFTAGGSAANHIAKWNGSNWSALGLGMNDAVLAVAVSGSDLYAGGDFWTAGGTDAIYIAKWDGSSWSALGSGVDDYVFALAASGSDLYAGGKFYRAGGSVVKRIAKWNGSTWSALGSGMAGGNPFSGLPNVFALAVSGSDLYAGGAFTTAGGKVSSYVARAYLLTLPTLSVLHSGTNIMVSWPSVDTAGFALQRAGTPASPPNWVSNTASVTDDGTNKSVTIPATNSPQFFRLRRP